MATSKSKPIDSFIRYFNNIKPYHTQILEVLESYKFNDNIDVTITEKIFFEIEKINNPLCQGTGFGINFDNECGFDALECCDIFDCVGDFGLIFDNSDLLVTSNVLNIDYDADIFTIEGNHTYDEKFNILSVPTNNTVEVQGDVTSLLTTHAVFTWIPVKTWTVQSTTTDSFIISGNQTEFFPEGKNFKIYNDEFNSGRYNVQESGFDSVTNTTKIIVGNDVNNTSTGIIEVESLSFNNGFYTHTASNFDGIVTTITVDGTLDYTDANTTQFGSIAFKTGMLPFREITHDDTVDETDYLIKNVSYDYTNDQTIVEVYDNVIDNGQANGTLKIYGYDVSNSAGFDGEKCSVPKDYHLYNIFSEYLDIEVTSLPPLLIAGFTHTVNDLSVDFDASAIPDPNTILQSYEWDFGDSNTATTVTPTNLYASYGNYDVTLTITDIHNRRGTYMETINVAQATQKWDLPNINPNSIGSNAQTGLSYYNLSFANNSLKAFSIINEQLVRSYDLSTAGDMTTTTYNNDEIDLHTLSGTSSKFWRDFKVSNDGTDVWLVAYGDILQLTMTTPYDLSTLQLNPTTLTTNAWTGWTTYINEPASLDFNDDGTILYVVGTDAVSFESNMYQFTLSTAYDITTATFVSQIDLIALTLDSGHNIHGFTFNEDGTQILINGNLLEIFNLELSTAWDISSATYTTGDKFNISNDAIPNSTIVSDLNSVTYYNTGSNYIMHVTDWGTDNIYQFTLPYK